MTHPATLSDALRDIELLSRIRSGDDNAFNELVNAYAERLYRFAYMRSRDSGLAEDAVQDVFVYVWKNRESLIIRDTLKSYLYRSVANRTLSILRHYRSQQRIEQMVVGDDIKLRYDGATNEGESRLQIEELQKLTRDVLMELPPRTREIFLLSKEQGLSYAEIASILNIGIPTIRNQVSRATQALLMALQYWEKDI